ncbi:MAG: hypothetical protein AB7O26_08740, partial [Planctomycetaceae bacterium]
MHPLIVNWFSARRIARPIVLFVAVATCAPSLRADETNSPSAKIVLRNPNEVLNDLDVVMKLTTPVEQKQLPITKEYIEVFLDGVNRDMPVVIDLKFGGKYPRQVWNVPISDFNKFRKTNLAGLGINATQKGGFYELKNAFKGWMKYAAPYASIGETQADIPAASPQAGVPDLLGQTADVAVEGANSKIDAAAQADRRKTFQESRKEILAAIKKKKDEDQSDFDLKKKVFGYQLDEAERFFAESQKLLVRWQTDAAKNQGIVNFELTPIAGTTLESQIAPLGTAPSHFATIERSATPILSGRLNHPLDAERKKTLLDLSTTLRTKAKEEADSSTTLSTGEKDATRKIADIFFDMINAGVNAGLMDGFVEVRSNPSGKNTLVCGVRAADGTPIVDIIKLVPESRKGRQSKVDADKEGDVQIHEVTINEKDHPHYQSFFGGPTLYIGSSKETVWIAVGENALTELKATIKKRGEGTPAADPVFGKLYVKLQPWMKLREDRDPKQGNPKLRKLGLEAFSDGADIVHGEMRQEGKKILGNVIIETGILRFAGKAIAD